ncbi:MAG: ATP-grasp domain-containing protein [Solirubrobacteraceae bacterium]
MAPKLGILQDSGSHRPDDLFNGIGDAAQIVWIVLDGKDGGRVRRMLMERFGTVVDIRRDDLTAAAATLAAAGIDGIVTFRDELLPVAAELATRLDRRHNSVDSVAALTNKFLQRQALGAAGVAQPRFWHLDAGLAHAEIHRIAASVSYPAMVKPAHGAASRGVRKVQSVPELIAAYDAGSEQLAEEYMADSAVGDDWFGSYVSVESTVSGTDISHVAVTGRFLLSDGFRENGIFIPSALDAQTTHQVLELASAAIRALEVTDSCLHIEIKLTPEGPKIIEVNGRLGGGPPAVLSSVSDVNLFRVAADIALGRPVRFAGPVACSAIGYWWDVNPPLDAVRVLAVHGTEELARADTVDRVDVRAPPGTELDPASGTLGMVAVRGRTSSYAELSETARLINRTIKIDYERLGDQAGQARG